METFKAGDRVRFKHSRYDGFDGGTAYRSPDAMKSIGVVVGYVTINGVKLVEVKWDWHSDGMTPGLAHDVDLKLA